MDSLQIPAQIARAQMDKAFRVLGLDPAQVGELKVTPYAVYAQLRYLGGTWDGMLEVTP